MIRKLNRLFVLLILNYRFILFIYFLFYFNNNVMMLFLFSFSIFCLFSSFLFFFNYNHPYIKLNTIEWIFFLLFVCLYVECVIV